MQTSCQHTAAIIFDPSVRVFWLFHAPEQTTAIVVLPSIDLVCGTVFVTGTVSNRQDWMVTVIGDDGENGLLHFA